MTGVAIVLIEGFSSQRGMERLKILKETIEQEFPNAGVFTIEYFEKYGWLRKFFRKKRIPEYTEVTAKDFKIIEGESKKIAMILGKDFPLIIIGYSMGGLVSRHLIEKMGFRATAAILVGTPNKGIKINLWDKLLLKIFRTPCVKDMIENNEFLQELNKYHERQPPIPYYLIGGSEDEIVPLESALSVPWLTTEFSSDYTTMVETNHLGLIPTDREKINGSAIPIIIKIIEKLSAGKV